MSDIILEGHTLAVKLIEPWAIIHEQTWHREALQQFGEKIVLRIAWKVEDFEAGEVDRCTSCMQGGSPTVQQRYAELYKDSGDSRCLDCYGIGFEGGFRPFVYITYMIVVDDPEDRIHATTGEMVRDDPQAQFLWDPKVGEYDLIVRVDSWLDAVTPAIEHGRYRLDDVTPQTVRTGERMADSQLILISQSGRISLLPADDIYQEVPVI